MGSSERTPRNRPKQDEGRNRASHRSDEGVGREPRGVQTGIADADKQVRTGKTEEHVRDTPPAGRWNDTSSD
jgi:hypothetical protein